MLDVLVGFTVVHNLLISYFQVYAFEILFVVIGTIGVFSQTQEEKYTSFVLKIYSKGF